MLVCRSHSGSDIGRAQTQPPAWASTMLRPIERSSVLFPDMFDPVIEEDRSGRADRDVVGDAPIVRNERVADAGRRHFANRPDRWDGPLGIVAARSAEPPERIEFRPGRRARL